MKLTKRPGTAVVALRPRLDALLVQVKDNATDRAVIGQGLVDLKAEYPHGAWSKERDSRAREIGVAPRTVRFYMQCAEDAGAREKQREREKTSRSKGLAQANLKPAPSEPAEHTPTDREAAKQMAAYAARAHTAIVSGGADRHEKYNKYRASSLAAFKALIERSNLPQIAGMTADQIIEVIKQL